MYHRHEVLLPQFSLYVQKGGLKSHFILFWTDRFLSNPTTTEFSDFSQFIYILSYLCFHPLEVVLATAIHNFQVGEHYAYVLTLGLHTRNKKYLIK